MPWEDKGVVMLRREFIDRAIELKENISKLCREYSISRPTAYKWLERYKMNGVAGLTNRTTRPSRMPRKIEGKIRNLILCTQKKYPAWGGRKLRQVLLNQGVKEIPSESTFNRILIRERRVITEEIEKEKKCIRFEREKPNELWQMDFKGYFSIQEGKCHPLTILDDCSRYAICLKACLQETHQTVKQSLEEVFREYGLPEAMTMDNGPPWFGGPYQRFSRLTIWLMRLGIRVTHSRPQHPQTQGKDERFHRTLKEELLKYQSCSSLVGTQKIFDEWRYLYNHIRPHEALQMKCPSDKYQKSGRAMPSRLPTIEYQRGDEVRVVSHAGEIRFKGERYFLGEVFRGEKVAVRQRTESRWDIYYANNWLKSFSLEM